MLIVHTHLDPRHMDPQPITPPDPLPYVSRRALARVREWVPPPDVCPNCGSEVKLVNNIEIYRSRSYGEWPYAYRCVNDRCDSFVGLHKHTDLPLGTLATKAMRDARKDAKAVFHDLMDQWSGVFNRSEMYTWLAKQLGIPKAHCHFGMFDVPTCRRALQICLAELKERNKFGKHTTF